MRPAHRPHDAEDADDVEDADDADDARDAGEQNDQNKQNDRGHTKKCINKNLQNQRWEAPRCGLPASVPMRPAALMRKVNGLPVVIMLMNMVEQTKEPGLA